MGATGFLVEAAYWVLVVLGVGLLIFIHELGHFAVAKWAKVKVLAFSLGFGPVIAGFRRGDTHYRLSAIPLGGYVKMSGENEVPEGGHGPGDFASKPIWVRAMVMLAGVVMNGILAFVLFGAAFAVGVRVDPARAGSVLPGKPAWRAGIRPGDVFVSADGHRLLEFQDLQHASLEGRPVELEVERDGTRFRATVTPVADAAAGVPVIGVGPYFGNRLEVPDDGEAARAGLRTGDEVVAVEGVPMGLPRLLTDPLVDTLRPVAGPLHLTVRRDTGDTAGPVTLDIALPPSTTEPMIGITPYRDTLEEVRPGGDGEGTGFRAGQRILRVAGTAVRGERSFLRLVLRAPPGPVSVDVESPSGPATLVLPPDGAGRLAVLSDLVFARDPHPTRVEVLPDAPPAADGSPALSPAEAAGIPNGARIETVGGAVVVTFADLVARLRKEASLADGVAVGWRSGERAETVRVAPVPFPRHALVPMDDRPVLRVTAPGELGARAWGRTVLSLRNLVTTLKGMFGGSVDHRNLGGVILIGQVARSSAEEGAGKFLWVLAMLSVNLAVLNLLPIPVLDGGQLALLGVEAVLGRPPSEGVVVASQWVGLLLILGLMGLGLFNDVGRLMGG